MQKLIKEAYIVLPQDPSVGMFSATMTLSDINLLMDKKERETFRKELSEMFGELFDDKNCYILFDDETEE